MSVDVTTDGSVTTVTLNRPKVMNAFDEAVAARIADAVGAAADDASCRVIVITGAGRGFCAGADLGCLREIVATHDHERARDLVSSGARIVQTIVSAPKPVIAAVNGAAAGGGASLALACDIRIASSDASLGAVFTRIGLQPDLGATYLLPLLAGFGRAMELVLTGEMIQAPEAHRIGLFNRVVAADALLDEAYAVARALARQSPAALARTKSSMHAAIGGILNDALARELKQQLALVDTEEVREALFRKSKSAR
jgi:2-(1,2-epoxy-1,2-dihydrophenyl)acetyl-CoA isomerase